MSVSAAVTVVELEVSVTTGLDSVIEVPADALKVGAVSEAALPDDMVSASAAVTVAELEVSIRMGLDRVIA